MLKFKDPACGGMRTALFGSESNPPHITWQRPQQSVSHVIECSGKFVTVEQAFAHIQTEYHTAAEARGPLEVLIAAATTDAPRFFPGINLRDYRVERILFACAPPAGSNNTDNGNDVWQYSSHVLDLLSKSSTLPTWLLTAS